MRKTLPYLALLLSTIAIVLAGVAYARSSCRAETTIRERERAFIDRMWPLVERMYKDMPVEVPHTKPDTIAVLLEPFLQSWLATQERDTANQRIHQAPDGAGDP